jgi:hypothetical protein
MCRNRPHQRKVLAPKCEGQPGLSVLLNAVCWLRCAWDETADSVYPVARCVTMRLLHTDGLLRLSFPGPL